MTGTVRVPLAQDTPRPVEPVALWSETYAFVAYDPKAQAGIWLHVGRYPYAPRLWRTMLCVYGPDGVRYLRKNYSSGDETDGPAAGPVGVTCVDPYRHWRLSYEGPAVRSTEAALAAGPLADGLDQLVGFDLDFACRDGAWDLASHRDLDDQDWGNAHFQQLGTVTGTITLPEGEIALEAYAWRDHSYGPRDMGPLRRHALVTGRFDGLDLGFTLFDLRAGAGDGPEAIRQTGQLMRGATAEVCDGVALTVLDDLGQYRDAYTFQLPIDGELATIEATILAGSSLSLVPPNHGLLGTAREGGLVLWETHVEFRWGDHVGYGYTERSLNVPPRT
jgi:hypothetical protein